MKKTLVVLTLLLVAVMANGATKADLKDTLAASGNYVLVSDPVLIPVGGSPLDRMGTKYSISLTKVSPDDSLVVTESAVYLRVVDDGLPSEAAYFINGNPLVVRANLIDEIRAFMVANGFSGYVQRAGTIGDTEFAEVVRYIQGPSGVGFTTTKTYRVDRLVGQAWSFTVME